jgi:hypothetical protein
MLVPDHGRVVMPTGRECYGRMLRHPRGVMNRARVKHQGLCPEREKKGDGDQGVVESASYRAMHRMQSVRKSRSGKGPAHRCLRGRTAEAVALDVHVPCPRFKAALLAELTFFTG